MRISRNNPIRTNQVFQDQQDDITRPWRCEPCGYSTSIASNLRIHLSSEKHAQAVRKLDAVFLCGICTKFTSETAEQLEQHVSRWRHVEEDFGLQQQADFYVCNLCNYQTQVNFEQSLSKQFCQFHRFLYVKYRFFHRFFNRVVDSRTSN